jgi:hypothetical protein
MSDTKGGQLYWRAAGRALCREGLLLGTRRMDVGFLPKDGLYCRRFERGAGFRISECRLARSVKEPRALRQEAQKIEKSASFETDSGRPSGIRTLDTLIKSQVVFWQIAAQL